MHCVDKMERYLVLKQVVKADTTVLYVSIHLGVWGVLQATPSSRLSPQIALACLLCFVQRHCKLLRLYGVECYDKAIINYEAITITGLDRPLGIQEFEAPRISRQSLHVGGKVVSITPRPPLPQEIFLVLISFRRRVDPRSTVRLEGLSQWKLQWPIGNRTRDLPACSAVS